MDDELRQRIITRVGPRFFEEGFSRVTTEELSRELGISKKTLYREFGSKEELVREVVRRQLRTVEQELLPVFDDESRGFLERIAAQLRVATRIMNTLGKPFLSDLARYAPDIWEEIHRFRQERVFSRMEGLLKKGQEEEMVRREVDPELLVLIIVTIADNLLTPGKLATVDKSPQEVVRHMGLMVSQGLLTEKGRSRIELAGVLAEEGGEL